MGTCQKSATEITSIDEDIRIYCFSLLSTVSKTYCILMETTCIFHILTWWIGAYTYKEYVLKKAPQKYPVSREILQFLSVHHHQQ